MSPPRARVSGSWRSVAHRVQPFQVGSAVQIDSRASHDGRAASCSSRNFDRARSRFAVFGETRRSGVLRRSGPERFIAASRSGRRSALRGMRTGTGSRQRSRSRPAMSRCVPGGPAGPLPDGVGDGDVGDGPGGVGFGDPETGSRRELLAVGGVFPPPHLSA